jgi:hypothetical protein
MPISRSSRRVTLFSSLHHLSVGTHAFFLLTCVLPSLNAQIISPAEMGLGKNTAIIPPLTTGLGPATTPAKKNEYRANPGPWGELVGAYIYLEAPESLVERFSLPSLQPRWTFPAEMRPQLADFLKGAGLDENTTNRLLIPTKIVQDGDFIHLLPTIADIENLSTLTRTKIYIELAKYAPNEYQVDPVLILGGNVQEWYRGSSLRPELIAKIDKLSYIRGETLVFSDVVALLSEAQSDTEARKIFKACTRSRSLMVRLMLDDNSDLEQLTDYWTLGIGVRRKDIEPIMRSIVESEVLHDLSLTQLIPGLPRKLLYTFPDLDMAKNGLLPDCHWTSLNFFNYEPHEYLLDSNLASSRVLEQFNVIEPPYQFGDILFFVDDQTGDAFHSCVHLADSLVFTKNGRNVMSPWVITTIDDVKQVYLFRGNSHIQGFRRKDIELARGLRAAAK